MKNTITEQMPRQRKGAPPTIGNREVATRMLMPRPPVDLDDRLEVAKFITKLTAERDQLLEVSAANDFAIMKLKAQRNELLAACKAIVNHAKETYPHFESTRGLLDIARAEAAIAKAERTNTES